MFFGGFASFHKESREHVAFLTVTPGEKKSFEWFLSESLISEPPHSAYRGTDVSQTHRAIRRRGCRTRGQISKDIQLFFHPKHGKVGERLHPVKMLVLFPYVSRQFGKILDCWFSKRNCWKPYAICSSG